MLLPLYDVLGHVRIAADICVVVGMKDAGRDAANLHQHHLDGVVVGLAVLAPRELPVHFFQLSDAVNVVVVPVFGLWPNGAHRIIILSRILVTSSLSGPPLCLETVQKVPEGIDKRVVSEPA